MPPDEYLKAFDKAIAELETYIQQRDLLNAAIAGSRETVRVLAGRINLPQERRERVAQLLDMLDNATPSLTDSIKVLLTSVYPKELTAVEVRNALEEQGFAFDEFSNSLSACHAALKRLVATKDTDEGKKKDGKVTYKRAPRLIPLIAPPDWTAFEQGLLGRSTVPLNSLSSAPRRGSLAEAIRRVKEQEKK